MSQQPPPQRPQPPQPDDRNKGPVSPSGEKLSGPFYWLRIFLAGLLGVGLASVGTAAAVIGILVIVGVAGLLIAWAGAWAILFIGLALGAAYYIRKKDLEEAAAPKPQVVREIFRPHHSPFGDAGWAYEEEIDRFDLVPMTPEHWVRAIWLGRAINVEWNHGLDNPMQNKRLVYSGENNIVTFSSAGGGKNAATIMPTLLTSGESAFVNDMKGENWFVTHRTREVGGHKIVCINPFNLYGKELGYLEPMTAHFNPLGALRPEQPDFISQINTLADALIVSEGKEPHWTSRARDLVAGIMAHLCADEDKVTAGQNTLPAMRAILGKPVDELTAFCEQAAEKSTVPLVKGNLARFATDSKENDSIVSTALGQLSFLTEPALIEFLSRSDFDFRELRTRKTTVYCMIPDALMNTYYRFVRVLVQSCFNTLTASPPDERAPVLMLLDEQAKLGAMEIIKTSAATLRGRNVRIWSVFQDLNQLKSLYPEAWETFLANAGVIQVMTVNDAVTANYFSEKVGKRGVPVPSQTSSTHFGQGPGGATSGGGSGVSVSEQAVPFLTPQHFYAMEKNKAVVFVQGLAYPVKVERLEYWKRQDQYGQPNIFQPWDTINEGNPGIPYTLNPEYDPAVLDAERIRHLQLVAEREAAEAGNVVTLLPRKTA